MFNDAAVNDHRSSPFSISDFQQLVSTAFDLHQDFPSPYHQHTRCPSVPDVVPSDLSRLQHTAHRRNDSFSLLRSIKTRASALLRSSVSPSHATIPATSPPSSRPSTARPSLSSQCTLQPTHHVIHSSPLISDLHHPINTPPPRVRTRSLPKSSRPMSVHHHDPIPPFMLEQPTDHDTRPITSHPVRIHSFLPPLRKARSFAPSIFSRKSRRFASKHSDRSSPSRSQSSFSIRLSSIPSEDQPQLADSRCPSPFTNPRDPPRPPSFSSDLIFQRRGSATSSCTMSSTKSSSTFSDKVTGTFGVPIPLPFMSKSRSRSKLHLSVPISSPQSSPSSSFSTATTAATSPPATPVSPTFSFSGNSTVFAPPAKPPTLAPNASRTSLRYTETVEEALAIGRVLTPDHDPFAKPEISLERNGDRERERDVASTESLAPQSEGRSPPDSPTRSVHRHHRGPSCAKGSLATHVNISPSLTAEPVKNASPSAKRERQPHTPPPAVQESPLFGRHVNLLKPLPPVRPPSRPLPSVPVAEDVFGGHHRSDSDPSSTPLRNIAKSPRSVASSPGKTSPLSSPLSSGAFSSARGRPTANNKPRIDRPPSPFPLVRELNAGSKKDQPRERVDPSRNFSLDDPFVSDSHGFHRREKSHGSRSLLVLPASSFTNTPTVDAVDGQQNRSIPPAAHNTRSLGCRQGVDQDTWDQETTHSTAFFSARSSLLSSRFSTDSHEEAERVSPKSILGDYSLRLASSAGFRGPGSKSWI